MTAPGMIPQGNTREFSTDRPNEDCSPLNHRDTAQTMEAGMASDLWPGTRPDTTGDTLNGTLTDAVKGPITFEKYVALGNDFLIVHATPADLSADAIRRCCDRRHGVGADGMIFVEPLTTDRFKVTLYNRDGSRAEFSGNGFACAIHSAGRKIVRGHWIELVSDSLVFSGRCKDRDAVELIVDFEALGAHIETYIPTQKVQIWFEKLTTLGIFEATRINIGNPHLIIDCPDLEDPDLLEKLSPMLDDLRRDIPSGHGGVNLSVTWPDTSAGVDVRWARTWERGAGPTPACASGALAVYLTMWSRHGVTLQRIRMPGGELAFEAVQEAGRSHRNSDAPSDPDSERNPDAGEAGRVPAPVSVLNQPRLVFEGTIG